MIKIFKKHNMKGIPTVQAKNLMSMNYSGMCTLICTSEELEIGSVMWVIEI